MLKTNTEKILDKLWIIIGLWVLDKIIMLLMFYVMN